MVYGRTLRWFMIGRLDGFMAGRLDGYGRIVRRSVAGCLLTDVRNYIY